MYGLFREGRNVYTFSTTSKFLLILAQYPILKIAQNVLHLTLEWNYPLN